MDVSDAKRTLISVVCQSVAKINIILYEFNDDSIVCICTLKAALFVCFLSWELMPLKYRVY